MSHAFAAVDLGASSGRVMVGRAGPGELALTEAHRFVNEPVRVGGTLHWDILALYRGVLEGLRRAGPVDAIGIDSWAVDYGLLDASGALLGNPIHYRDARTDGVAAKVAALVPNLYARTGLQKLPFNTIYQLVSAQGSPQLAAARQLLLIPDLLAYWLTGVAGAEVTNASTTQLLDLRTGSWARDLAVQVGIDPDLLPPLRRPGDLIGPVRPGVGVGTPDVIAVGSHDTASAVVGVPAGSERFAYISCGTWSLVGVELDAPVLTEASLLANFTNEGGVDGKVRYLRNVMGLWPLQECLREWGNPDLPALLAEAATLSTGPVVDLDDPVYLPPGGMQGRLAGQIGRELSRAGLVRCIVDSLALAHKKAIEQAQELSGRHVDVVHVVGGGARNELLCQLTADACGLPVLAGPVEATALGNVLVQARAAGVIGGDLGALRTLIRQTHPIKRYEPRGG